MALTRCCPVDLDTPQTSNVSDIVTEQSHNPTPCRQMALCVLWSQWISVTYLIMECVRTWRQKIAGPAVDLDAALLPTSIDAEEVSLLSLEPWWHFPPQHWRHPLHNYDESVCFHSYLFIHSDLGRAEALSELLLLSLCWLLSNTETHLIHSIMC